MAEREKFNQEGAAHSTGLLLASQEQNWEKHIEMEDEGSMVLLQIPHFVG